MIRGIVMILVCYLISSFFKTDFTTLVAIVAVLRAFDVERRIES